MTTLQSPEEFAEQFAGNYRRWPFFWHRRGDDVPDPDNWGIYHFSYDPSPLEESNGRVMIREFAAIDPNQEDWRNETYGGAFGSGEGFSLRVKRDDGTLAPVFLAYCSQIERMEDYPVLDEVDWSALEYERTIEMYTMACGDWLRANDREGDAEAMAFEVYSSEPCPEYDRYPSDDSIAEVYAELYA